jgi:hypothetical protein
MFHLILYLVLIGALVGFVLKALDIPSAWKQLILVVAVIFTLLWLMDQLGFVDIPIHRIR